MRDFVLIHVSDAALLKNLAALVVLDRSTTAWLLAHVAEVDVRRLYVPAGYPSMFAYCVEKLKMSEDSAGKRIQAARAARRFPALFRELAAGRMHLTGVCLLAPYLKQGNAPELIESAVNRRKSDIEVLLSRRFPPPEPRAVVRAIAARPPGGSMGFANALAGTPDQGGLEVRTEPKSPPTEPRREELALQSSPLGDSESIDRSETLTMSTAEHAPAHAQKNPITPTERFLVHVLVDRATYDKLRHAQALLSHSVPSGNVAQVLARALEALITQLEKRKFGAGPRHKGRARGGGRT